MSTPDPNPTPKPPLDPNPAPKPIPDPTPAAPAQPPTPAPTPTLSNALKNIGSSGNYTALGKLGFTNLKSILTNPLTYVILSVAAFCITFGYSFYASGVDLNSLDPSTLKYWWVGTVVTSVVFLLLFYIVFNQLYFNRALIFMLMSTFVILHVSLLLTQMNLSV